MNRHILVIVNRLLGVDILQKAEVVILTFLKSLNANQQSGDSCTKWLTIPILPPHGRKQSGL